MEMDTGPAPNALCAYKCTARAEGIAHEIPSYFSPLKNPPGAPYANYLIIRYGKLI
jgi:hypothetical protein